MLRDKIALFTKLSGRDGEHTPIGVIGAYLDGYEKGCEDAKAKYERPHGKWIKENNPWGGFGDCILVNTCSICGESYIYHGENTNYCPNCGSDMREDEV